MQIHTHIHPNIQTKHNENIDNEHVWAIREQTRLKRVDENHNNVIGKWNENKRFGLKKMSEKNHVNTWRNMKHKHEMDKKRNCGLE